MTTALPARGPAALPPRGSGRTGTFSVPIDTGTPGLTRLARGLANPYPLRSRVGPGTASGPSALYHCDSGVDAVPCDIGGR